MRAALLVLILLSFCCHHEVKKDEHVEVQETNETAKVIQNDVAETKLQEASEVDIKTSRSEDAIIIQDADGSIEVAKVTPGKPLKAPKGSKVIGTVPLASTTVDQNKHIGAKVDEKVTETAAKELDRGTKNVHDEIKTDTITDTGPGIKFYGFCLLAFVIALAAGYCYLKFMRKVAWL